MKKICFLAAIVLLCFDAKAQKDTVGLNIPIKDGHIVYEGIVEVLGMSKLDLYKNAKQWFVDYFKSSKDVIQNEDKEQGLIVGKGLLPIFWKSLIIFEYHDNLTIQIDCRDGKYRYKIYDLIIIVPPSQYTSTMELPGEYFINKMLGSKPSVSFTKGQSKKIIEATSISISETITSLNKIMKSKPDIF